MNHYSWWPLPADRALSQSLKERKEASTGMFFQKPPGRERQVGQLHHEPVSPEQSQRTGSLAQSVMLRLPTTLCSWLPEPASPEVGSHKTRYAGCPPTAASRAQGREKGVSEASPRRVLTGVR